MKFITNKNGKSIRKIIMFVFLVVCLITVVGMICCLAQKTLIGAIMIGGYILCITSLRLFLDDNGN